MTPGLPNGSDRRSINVPDHELLSVIDRGGYGEVWLARNATGAYRAVKIVRRDHFESDAPFDREFKGIEAYEPISRAHPNLIAILHIGCKADAFYYIMELADPLDGEWEQGMTATIDLKRYRPRTLREEVKRNGSLPVHQCLEIALSLARALGHLHGHGLIHRDIKPSNVIFVGGVAKLADVGLVTEPDHTLSLVGTEGFIPPEGPGSAPADIYALGKVLYELNTGRDRKDFPELPTSLRADPELPRRIEFNEVVLKASAKSVDQRYQRADALVRDLEILQGGGSLLRSRRVKRFTRQAIRVAGGTVLIGALVSVGVMVGRRDDRESPLSPPAREVQLVTVLDTGTLDLRLSPTLVLGRARTWDFSPDGKWIVSASDRELMLWRRERGTTRPIVLENPERWQFRRPRWSPDSHTIYALANRFVPAAESGEDPREEWAVAAINPNDGTVKILQRCESIIRDLCICPATARLAIAVDSLESPRIYWLDPAGGSRAFWDLADSNLRARFGEISPDGRWLAVQRNEKVDGRGNIDIWLLPAGGGTLRRLTKQDGVDAFPTWAPDGRTIYFASGDSGGESSTWNLFKLEIDPESGEPTGLPEQVTEYFDAQVCHPKVLANGKEIAHAIVRRSQIAFTAREGDPESIRQLVGGRQVVLTRDGRRAFYVVPLGDSRGIYRINLAGSSSQQLTSLVPLGGNAGVGQSYDVAPDGESIVFVATGGDKMVLVRVDVSDPHSHRSLVSLPPTDQCVPRWSPNGRWIAFAAGRFLSIVGADGSGHRELATLDAWEGWTVRWSADGSKIAALGYETAGDRSTNHAYVVGLHNAAHRRITPASESKYKEGLEWHPDGERLTYLYYGPRDKQSEIRVAYPDGGPTSLLIDQPTHWEYVGWWHPRGRRFFFTSDHKLHVFDSITGAITDSTIPPALEATRPQWSRDGATVLWTTKTVSKQLVTLTGLTRLHPRHAPPAQP